MNNNITFKAKFINPVSINRCSMRTTPKSVTASFVELSSSSKADRNALRSVNYEWGDRETFASVILSDFEGRIFGLDYKNAQYYALTLQKRDLDNPIAEKILGLAEIVTGEHGIKLKYLQADPQNNMHSSNAKYRGVGTAILDSIKTLFPNSDIEVQSTTSAESFYKFNGFKKFGPINKYIFKHLSQ